MTISATLWSVWLFRNELVFRNSKASRAGVVSVLRARIQKWLEVSGVLSNNLTNLFTVNPRGAIRLSYKQQCDKFWEDLRSRYDWVIAVDGAVQKKSNSQAKAGIGGTIRSKQGNLEYIFSGASKVQNALDAEKEACMHIINILAGKAINTFRVVICSDSIETITYLDHLKYEIGINSASNLAFYSVLDQVDFKEISRSFNSEADGLAKEGIRRAHMVEGWV